MRVVGALLGVVLGIGALAATIWVARYAPWVDQTRKPGPKIGSQAPDDEPSPVAEPEQPKPADRKSDKNERNRPPVAEKPPYPKAIAGERVYEFGSMAVNEEKKHTFTITNKGEAPLDLEIGPCSCKCTLSGLSKKKANPGETVNVELTWKPFEVAPNFMQQCAIWTSDPDRSEIEFKVYGTVGLRYTLSPEKVWHTGLVTDVQEGVATGELTSGVQTFAIKSVESPNPHVKATYKPMGGMQLSNTKKKGGYEFTVRVDKGMPMGPFRVPLSIHTTLEGNLTVGVDVTGSRSGPILFLPPIGRAMWNGEISLLNLGRVRHETGTKVMLPAVIFGMKEKFQVLKTTNDADFLNVSVKPDPEIASGEQQGLLFVFEVPPGAPAVTRDNSNPVHVTIETNHPQLKELQFTLEFVGQ